MYNLEDSLFKDIIRMLFPPKPVNLGSVEKSKESYKIHYIIKHRDLKNAET